jgi:hypothetical protein
MLKTFARTYPRRSNSPSGASQIRVFSSSTVNFSLPMISRRLCKAASALPLCTRSQGRQHRLPGARRGRVQARTSSVPARTGACKYWPAAVRGVSPAECRAACPARRSCVSSDLDRQFLLRSYPAISRSDADAPIDDPARYDFKARHAEWIRAGAASDGFDDRCSGLPGKPLVAAQWPLERRSLWNTMPELIASRRNVRVIGRARSSAPGCPARSLRLG